MTTNDGIILLDPYPRTIDLLFTPDARRRLEKLGRVIWHDGSKASDAHIEKYLPDTVALIGQTDLPKARLDLARRLRVIANVESNFLPNVDYLECHRRNIPVIATGPAFGWAVAEMSLGLALSAARRIHEADAAIRQSNESLYGEQDNHDSFLLHGKTLGIVGLGNIGKLLLSLLKPFSNNILVHDPWLHPSMIREAGAIPVSMEELFAQSRVAFILAASTTENAGGIGAKYFRSMIRGSIVVLTSRAAVVNFDELLDAAQCGHIRAAIDVFPQEPIPAEARVRRTPNTILQAHRAGNIPEIWPLMGDMVVDDLEMVLRGLAPQRCQRATLETVSRLRSKPSTQGAVEVTEARSKE